MKLRLLRQLSLALLLFALVTGCGKETDPKPSAPVSCFELPEISPKANEPVLFKSCAKNANSWVWEFGDGTMSTLESPEHTYSSAGDFTVTLTVSNDTNLPHTISQVITVLDVSGLECITHGVEFIRENQIWKKGCHIVTNFIQIENGATLTIEAGAVVKFHESGYIAVSSEGRGALIAEGTEAERILFTSAKATPATGDWDGIIINGTAPIASSFKYCTFEYGGYDLFDDPSALVRINNGGRAKFDHCDFSKSYSYAILLDWNGGFEQFTNNHIHDIDEYAISITGNYAGTIGEGNVIENKGVLIGAHSVTMDTEWLGLTCPYVTESNLWVGSETGNTLTLHAGVRIEFQREQMLLPATNTSIATLITNGTAENPVVFTAHDPNELRTWGGIKLGNQFTANTYFRHTIFEKAQSAASQSSIIAIGEGTLNMENCSISGAKAYGIYMGAGAKFGTFQNNDFGALATFSIYIQVQNLEQIGANTFSGGKDVDLGFHQLTTDVVFPELPVNYYVDTELYMGSTEGNTVTFAPGSKFLLSSKSIRVGRSSLSTPALVTFRAVGTADKPIIIKRTDSEYSSGEVVDFSGEKIGPASIMEYCHVSSGTIGIRISNLYNDPATPYPTIRNNTISDCTSHAIYVSNSNPSIEDNNTYINNGNTNGVYYQ